MSSDDYRTVNSPAEMLAAMGGKARDPWDREESPPIRKTTEEERKALSAGFRSKAENERAKKIGGQKSRHIQTPNGCRNTHIDMEDYALGDPRKEIAGALLPCFLEEFAKEMTKLNEHSSNLRFSRICPPKPKEYKAEECAITVAGFPIEFPDDIRDQILDGTIKNEGQPTEDLGLPTVDPDVMGYLHSAFDQKPGFDPDEGYTVPILTATLIFEKTADDLWLVEIHTEGSYNLIEIDGPLSEATDAAKDRLREVIAEDMGRLR